MFLSLTLNLIKNILITSLINRLDKHVSVNLFKLLHITLQQL